MQTPEQSTNQHKRASSTAEGKENRSNNLPQEDASEKVRTQDPQDLPDGSGSNKRGSGSDQGQEDGPGSFDAG